jgi:hypothetical protein
MTPEDKKAILKIQKSLAQIKETGRAPINLTQYKKMGLIRVIHKNVELPFGAGTERRLDRLVLTDKGNQILNVII